MRIDLPARMSVLPHVHLSKAADVTNPDHINGEVAEEVDNLLDFKNKFRDSKLRFRITDLCSMAESKDKNEWGDNGREELVEEEESRVAEKLV